MLLDEPYVGLDTVAGQQVTIYLQMQLSRGCALLFVEHEFSGWLPRIGRLFLMRDGALVPLKTGSSSAASV
jgi:energy-coupling factor transporter ATP-binding protein EcfA2